MFNLIVIMILFHLILIYTIECFDSSKKTFKHKLLCSKLPNNNDNNNNNNNDNTDLKSFLLQSKERKLSSFNYSTRRGGHIVAQSFKYIPKEVEAEEIVSFMTNRQRLRLEANKIFEEKEENNICISQSQEDKRKNPLIAISGSPGIGKSTFLCHFPESKQYQEYCSKKESGKSPIVSILTFNSAMRETPDCFELRIIYGAIKAMGLNDNITWNLFLLRFKNYKINSNEVVVLLKELFGADRPILILVDEIGKSQNDKKIMTKIGNILDAFEFVDVIVSALSPNYIKKLLSKSNRPIDYAIVYPLINSELGKKECEIWTNNIISKCGNHVKLDDFKVNVLKNIYLLFSGHPRSIEIMKDLLGDKNKDWSKVIEDLIDRDVKFGVFLKNLLTYFKNEYSNFQGLDHSFFKEFVFRYIVPRSANDPLFRQALENGKVFVYSRNSDEFITCVQLQSILYYIASKDFVKFQTSKGILRTVYYFLNDFFSLTGSGIIWEKIVSLNIAICSFEKMTISELFGINFKKFYDIDCVWGIVIENSVIKRSKKDINYNKFIPPVDESQPGNDGLVVLNVNNELLHFYLQMKIKLDISDPKVIIEKVVTMISYNLLEYASKTSLQWGEVKYNNVHMILYVWGLEKENFENIFPKENFPKEVMEILVDKIFEKIKKKYETLPIGFDKEIINNYIKNHWDHFHFVGKEKLQTWLCPSFISFPLLATALD